ncbi:MAG: PAS domain S-box protein [Thermodesulfobacteriota bacterium]
MRLSLMGKLILATGLLLVSCMLLWSYFNINNVRQLSTENTVSEVERLGSTIQLGLHYAMLTYATQDIRQIIKNISTQPAIKSIRVYNKSGQIKYSNNVDEIEQVTDIREQACYVCHQTNPPLVTLDLQSRTRIFTDTFGVRSAGVLSPIYNEPACSNDPCHVHPADKQVLGLLDVIVSMQEGERKLNHFTRMSLLIAGGILVATSLALFFAIHYFVNRPVRRVIRATRQIAAGVAAPLIDVPQQDEMGELALAVRTMGREVHTKRRELEQQKNLYQNLYEHVPCYITVQDKDLRLTQFNQFFGAAFKAHVGELCYRAYKGREEPCENCPVLRSFNDSLSHTTEETGFDRSGNPRHFIVRTNPLLDENGNVTAVMEISVDVTGMRRLERELDASRKKYMGIFSHIPSAIFVLDRETLEILECNRRSQDIYGYSPDELLDRNFLDLFADNKRDLYSRLIREERTIERAKHLKKSGKSFFVSIRVSTSEYPGGDVFLVTCSDITDRLETEQQLIQAGKMTTLGEMATGVAHELNQPLAVIRTVGDLLARRAARGEALTQELLDEVATSLREHVERATKIITHMREFGRKSDLRLEPVDLAVVFTRACEFFNQQLALRNISVQWSIEPDLPPVLAEVNRIEQVFMNLIINARDAIEARWAGGAPLEGDPAHKRIAISVFRDLGHVVAEICDTGVGVPEEILERIFEPFFTTKDPGKGTGLGLSISYGIIKDYGGTIFARKKEGCGACFVIRLPAAA